MEEDGKQPTTIAPYLTTTMTTMREIMNKISREDKELPIYLRLRC